MADDFEYLSFSTIPLFILLCLSSQNLTIPMFVSICSTPICLVHPFSNVFDDVKPHGIQPFLRLIRLCFIEGSFEIVCLLSIFLCSLA